MSTAEQQVAKEIVGALEVRIAGWLAERQSIEVLRSKQDRKEARYQQLGELIAEAEKEIAAAAGRLTVEVKR
jgi:hypothetical protein